jgi:Tol biopolymer transport system component
MPAPFRFILAASISFFAGSVAAENGAPSLAIAVPGFAADDPAGDLGAQAILSGRLKHEGDGRLKVEAWLWDVARGEFLSGAQYFAEPGHSGHLGHIIADTIYTRLTGRDGRFEADNPN